MSCFIYHNNHQLRISYHDNGSLRYDYHTIDIIAHYYWEPFQVTMSLIGLLPALQTFQTSDVFKTDGAIMLALVWE